MEPMMKYTDVHNDEIVAFLKSIRIQAINDDHRILINRDSMCARYPTPGKIPEDKGGAYALTLQALRDNFPTVTLRWSFKTDEDYFLDVIE